MTGKPMKGGAVVEAAEVTTADTVPDEGMAMNIITTQRGVFTALGIVEPGTDATIPPRMFSDAWMKPATQRDQAVLDKWRKAQDTGADE